MRSKVDEIRRKRPLRTKQASVATSDGAHQSSHPTRRTRPRNCMGLRTLMARPIVTIVAAIVGWKSVQPIYEYNYETASRHVDIVSFELSHHKSRPTTALKQGHEILSGYFTHVLQLKQEWIKDTDIAYPVRDVLSSTQHCPDEEDFNMWIRARNSRWGKPSYLAEQKIWQMSIGDKIGGYLFARKMGVKVPRILFCTGAGPEGLANYVPKDRGFVVKDVYGHSSNNVYVMESGFGGKNRINQHIMSLEDIQNDFREANATDIYVEEVIDSGRDDGTVPDDYKFYCFNGNIVNIRVVRNRGTERHCLAFYDEDWNRHDQFGCFLHEKQKPRGNKADPTTGCYPVQKAVADNKRRFCSDVPPPSSYKKMLTIAKRLSKRIGVFMRIDMFENADGQVVLGKFTPFSSFGNYQCAAKVVDGCIDSCFLGRTWKESSLVDGMPYEYQEGWEKRDDGKMVKRVLPPLEGGPITHSPEYLKGWNKLSMEQKCEKIKHL